MARQIKSQAPGFPAPFRRGDLPAGFERYSGLALAVGVAAMVGLMIVPLPTLLLDLLITLNIATALVLLLIAIYVGDSLKLATFPSLLLLTTLFRLSIEVSATRLILLKANAGQVIHAFGSFVVAGNLVVGVVVFLILTTIQFVVIAKGASRVAEVGARFTLDAMPGKQMAIDAELRAGHIDAEEARRRRVLLNRESQFFGSMDGAMRFVRGDAVAGLVVLVTNIVGGLFIGVFQRGMELSAAIRTYTLLTIGEGLVAQIPALVLSTAAGIMVTRVSSDEEGGHLGRDIGRQVLAHPKALAVAAGLLAVLAIVPGLPALPFLVLAAALGLVARRLLGSERRTSATADRPLLAPLTVELAPDLFDAVALQVRESARRFPDALAERFCRATGIPLPGLDLDRASRLAAFSYVIQVQDMEVARGSMEPCDGTVLVETLLAELVRKLSPHGHLFVGIEETRRMLTRLEPTHPNLLAETVPKLVSLPLLADVLSRLAREGISLCYLPDILEALAKRGETAADAATLTEAVRKALRRQLTLKYGGPTKTVPVFFLDAMIEETLRESMKPSGVLALEPQLCRELSQAIARRVTATATPVILTSQDLRRHVRELIEPSQPHVAVLSHQELLPEAELQNLGQISIEHTVD